MRAVIYYSEPFIVGYAPILQNSVMFIRTAEFETDATLCNNRCTLFCVACKSSCKQGQYRVRVAYMHSDCKQRDGCEGWYVAFRSFYILRVVLSKGVS
jgi:hypothetical protein